jgi:hypothetical protein
LFARSVPSQTHKHGHQPIGSIATKIGIKATKNLWTML